MMEIRRRVLMGSRKKVIDTSPVIETYGCKIGNGNSFVEDIDYCITKIYAYPKNSEILTMVTGKVGNKIQVYRNGAYLDWWGWGNEGVQYARRCINSNSDGVRLCMRISYIPETYAYLKETGQILFAGKNTPYYGYTNINDMPQ